MLQKILSFFLLWGLATEIVAFHPLSPIPPTVLPSVALVSRQDFFRNTFAAAVLVVPLTASAKDSDASTKGTKADPAFQACISTCMYECTKPKADEQKTRQECLPECKAKCATTKAQLMVGTPTLSK